MKQLCATACRLLSCPTSIFAGVAIVSTLALAAALIAEVALGLEPCILCIYQRIPFAAGIILGLAGLALRKKDKVARIMIFLIGLAFLANTGIAAYHTGVEQHWWRSAVEGCAVNFESDEQKGILENILSAPTGNCAEIPWSDPVLGLSMANYNILLCFALFLICAAALLRQCRAGSASPERP